MKVMNSQVQRAEIVILGAGYGGLHVAQRLSSLLRDVRPADAAPNGILLVDRQHQTQLTTELPRLVGGERADGEFDIDLDRLVDAKMVRLLPAEVTAIRPAERRVDTAGGPIEYRYLVIALGSVSNDFGIPGVAEHMRQFLTTEDAHGLRIAAARAIEDAARVEQDNREIDLADLQRRLTVLIVGAGPTGVEVAGELTEFMAGEWEAQRRVAGEPPDYRLPRPHIILADAAPTILPGWSGKTIDDATAALGELGVEIRLNAPVARAEPERVTLKDGTVVEAGVLVWAGGVRAPKWLADAGLPTGSAGRVQVDRFQRVPGHEEIYVIGDSALVKDEKTGRPLPPTAALALREGETAALALAATLQGHDPSRVLKPLTGGAVSVGRGRGAANLLGIEVKGKSAHAVKDLIEWEYRESITRLSGYSAATVV
jgi:NADH dehydrogenase